ncbi:MAG TPA: hypothetical protein VIL63_07380, partial [Terriglobales bacterium]
FGWSDSASDIFSWDVISLLVPKTPSIGFAIGGVSEHDWMFAIAFLFVRVLYDCFKSRDDGLKPKFWCCGINSTS